ncbi:major facilitator superfamily protein [Artemisia annua]|uniref:Major facilitator superfamily protein n=1 Tax=Artemisia annua TaxID=35608 RepID=A0A2U1PZZ5_ARTAN|nr:major facilitator superfamily protein [Artemisia annua]
MPFIFENEVGEKLAIVGFRTNIISYLTQQLHMPMTQAADTFTNFSGTASLTALLVTVIVYIQDNIGWSWGLGIPSIAMALQSLAYEKTKLHIVSDPKLLYDNEELKVSISASGKLLHTKQMKNSRNIE